MTNANGASATWMQNLTRHTFVLSPNVHSLNVLSYNRHRLTEPAIHTTLPTIITTPAINMVKPRTELP